MPSIKGCITMKATKPQLRPRRRWSSSRGHMTLTLAMGPKRTNSRLSTSSSTSGARLPTYRLVVQGSESSKEPTSSEGRMSKFDPLSSRSRLRSSRSCWSLRLGHERVGSRPREPRESSCAAGQRPCRQQQRSDRSELSSTQCVKPHSKMLLKA